MNAKLTVRCMFRVECLALANQCRPRPALAAYEDFLIALCEDAGPDIPTLKGAKAEYAKLPEGDEARRRTAATALY